MDDIENISYSLETESDLDLLIEHAGHRRAVLIGGSTHGTAEFYKWRANITKRLIEEKGFSFVSVEGDWPHCYEVNRYVKGVINRGLEAEDILYVFNRWPTWIWANYETLDFIRWLAEYNTGISDEQKVGFYGLDFYSLWDSLSMAVKYLEETVPEAAQTARQVYRCFEPQRRDIDGHKWTIALVSESCEEDIAKFLTSLQHLPPAKSADTEERFNAEQNALAVVDAERYYRVMPTGDPDTWNLREQHMANTFFRLREFHGKTFEAKGIIWAHNAHICDAGATEMADRSETSVGQLVRERLGKDEAYLIGFGTFQGRVVAAYDWDAPVRDMELPPAIYGSWESVLHNLGEKNRLLLFSRHKARNELFLEKRSHRTVGVVYDPNSEFPNYIETYLDEAYDAFLHIDTTSALHPFPTEPKTGEMPGTFPSAV
ncbi:MAG: erythromycin esterase family protein [Firmicutes bacterium]|nr:erythromycin esterase family protein [Bacillota bacterium]